MKKHLIMYLTILYQQEKYKKQYTKKRYWVAPIFKTRKLHGFYHAILPNIILEDSTFKNYFRMSTTQFEELLQIVEPHLRKQITPFREPISAAERLCLTLRYLAAGDSMRSISYQYLIGVTTMCNIIHDTCDVIWSLIQKEVLPSTLSKEKWLRIADEFETKWNFNHCIGAIDGKHVVIQCPNNAGSSYYNYKNSHSIVLLAVCDANYIFTFVDIGAYGRQSDGGIFRSSLIGQKFDNKRMNLPEPQPISANGICLPYVLIGDEAFPLTEYLLRPYPGRGGLNKKRKIYNYRLSRARRMIESSFGILCSQWRILRRPINTKVETCMKIIQSIICIHNWLRIKDIGYNEYIPSSLIDRKDSQGNLIPSSWKLDVTDNSALQDITQCGSNLGSRKAIIIRDEFCHYFNSEGAIPWQYENC
ncbi:uncharacterized protein [Cardiocondyla obscurior]|uniref:uncharacterized protein n=1 Tax=Cardiocondyla obscurior TaxID=286306 RepID=UPI0039656D90